MSISNSRTSSEGRIVEMSLNAPQAMVHMVRANETWLLWGRGTGKTVGGISPWMVNVAEAMPGHLSGIFGKSFEHLDNNIMPKILLGLTSLGYQQGIDFVVGVRPPKDWPKCLYPIKKYERTITWRNGTTWQQVSLHDKGSANAFDFQSGIFDECKFFNKTQLDDEVLPTFRGFEHLFGHLPEYLSKIFATDKLADYLELEWILKKRELVDHERVQKILDAERLIVQLERCMDSCTPTKAKQIQLTIRKLHRQCNVWRKNLVFVCEASAIDNIDNLGLHWLADKKKSMGAYEFDVAILNIDPKQGKEGFYPGLTEANRYKQEAYYDASKPFVCAFDYQHSVTPMLVCQLTDGKPKPVLAFLKEFASLYPAGIGETVKQFAEYYKYHTNKRIYYIFDQTAIGKSAERDPLFKIVMAHLKKHGWKVMEKYMGDTPDHYDKYVKINGQLEGAADYQVMINEEQCPFALVSLQAANSKTVGGKTKKDKEYENAGKYPYIDQRKTTHFSDVFDQICWAVNEQRLIKVHRAHNTSSPIR